MPGKRGSKSRDARRPAQGRGSECAQGDWLKRTLSRVGAISPTDAETAIRAGRVQLAGRVVRDPMTFVRAGDELRVDGKPIGLEQPTLVLAFHKPAGVVVSSVDPDGQGTVFDVLLPALPPRLARYGWHAVGRLDRNTTGLLLFTNDERFVAHATLPATHLPKRYLARVLGRLDEARLAPLTKGLELDDGPTRPAQVRVRGPDEVELTLSEGRFHQVKRMLGAVGLPVRGLHREAIGAVTLDVPERGWRSLTEQEIREGLGFDPRPTDRRSLEAPLDREKRRRGP